MYVIINHYDKDGLLIGYVRCEQQHVDKHPAPSWVARSEVVEIAASVPKIIPVIIIKAPLKRDNPNTGHA